MAPSGPPPGFERPFRRTRPLKRWRWVGVFGEQLMACAAQVRIGPARQSFWALWRPGDPALRERTRLLPRRGEVIVEPGRLVIDDRGVRLDLELDEEAGFAARCPHGDDEVWTRKQAGIAARGTLRIEGASTTEPVQLRAVIDDTAGYHARVTEWRWSAGVGHDVQGVPLAWNLVSGVNDPPHGSERAVWLDGSPHEVGPVEFAPDLLSIAAPEGSRLLFEPLAERARSDNVLLVRSDYRAPFGVFSGQLPGGIALARGYGVMEHHRVRW